MAVKRRWRALSARTRRLILLAGTFEAVAKVAALVDLIRRPAAQIRGQKWAWATALLLVNSVGAAPAAYFPLRSPRRTLTPARAPLSTSRSPG